MNTLSLADPRPHELASPETPVGWRWAPPWVLAYVALLPAMALAETVQSLGALVALGLLAWTRFRGGSRLLSSPAWALTTALFFAYWIPELLSVTGAPHRVAQFKLTLFDLRYLPFLWLVAIAVATPRARRITFGGLAMIMLLWCLDGLIEAVSGHNPWFAFMDWVKRAVQGHRMCSVGSADRITGPLGPCNPKLGIVLASLSPFVLYAGHQRAGVGGWLVMALLTGVVLVLAGSRASWITYGLVLLTSGWNVLGWKRLAALFLVGVLSLAALSMTVPKVHERIQRSLIALKGDQADVDTASAGRLRIWSAASCMIRNHPLTGVGTLGFRDTFARCDPEPAKEPAWGRGPALHAHQLVLEILSETGALGLLCWLAGGALAWRAWRYASAEARSRARPAMIAVVATLFPLNTHLAFYAAFWGGISLMLVALFAGSLLSREDPA